MLKKLSMLLLSAFVFIVGASAQNQAILRGTIGNRTLSADTCYYLKGCVTVHNGTINIPAGTKIFGIDSIFNGTNYPGTLIIDTTGYIIANGTSTNPIIFTSGKPVGSRLAGDWGGIMIAGTAHSNQLCNGSAFIVEGPCAPIYAGGANDADSSGSLTYVQIHYAGRAVQLNNELNSLTLAAIGSKTVIDYIQVTNALDDAFEWFGGTVNAKHLVAYNTKDDDFDTDFGFRGKVQFGLVLRLDTAAHDISLSHGVESDNNNDAASDYTCGTYKTRPVFSNITILGPKFCGLSTVNSEYESAVQIRRNSAHSIYNSVIAGWPEGLFIADRATNPVNPGLFPTISNTAVAGVTNQLNFSYNTLSVTAPDFVSVPSAFTGGCGTMSQWITGVLPASPACREAGNQFLGTTAITGYSLCGNFCSARPNFAVGTTNVNAATFTGVTDLSGFDVVSYRGAFGATDWTADWTEWCPQSAAYNCGTSPLRAATVAPKVIFVPNPSNGSTYAVFNATQTGKVRVTVLDKVSGKALRTVNSTVTEIGEQHVAFNAGGLPEGVYFVQVELENGTVISGQLSVR